VHAVDVACCDLISVPLEQVRYLDRVPYQVLGCAVQDVRLRFAMPSAMVIANAHVHVAQGTCSRCLQSMHDGLSAFWRSPVHILRGTWSCILNRTDVITGQDREIPPTALGRLVCYGDCTRRLAEAHGLRWIPGCPPASREFLRMF
jgi:hypothetical protein